MSTSPGHSSAPARLSTLLLLAVTAAWGSSFFLTRELVASIPSADYLAVRFALAAAVMLPLLHRHVRALDRRELAAGVGLGLLYGLAQLLQTVGLEHTSATRSGFITGLYVVLTPAFAAALMRTRVGAATWAGSVMACLGLGVLCLGSVGWGGGESLTLACAAVYAAHILGLGAVSRGESALGLSAVQITVVALVCAVAAAPGGVRTPSSGAGWAVVAYLALVCGALAMWAQTWAQAHLPPTRAAIVMTMEPVFAALFAVWLGGEEFTWRVAVGGGLVLAAMYVVELRDALALPLRRWRSQRAGGPTVEGLHHEAGA